MGVGLPKPSIGCTAPPNPDPARYTIVKATEVNGWTVVLARYHGCTTYKGIKCLVFPCGRREVTLKTLLDPHFLENETSPVARFEPTKRGIALAFTICESRER